MFCFVSVVLLTFQKQLLEPDVYQRPNGQEPFGCLPVFAELVTVAAWDVWMIYMHVVRC